MNTSLTTQFINGLTLELRAYLELCEEILNLTMRENQALASQSAYSPSEFHQKRTHLLPNIELLLSKLRSRRLVWQQVPASEREQCREIKPMFEEIQNLLTKVLMLDRENQQIMLRRGMVPTSHLPAIATPKANYVASVYQRNLTARG
ncbi:MAG: hypothetical protein ABSE48_04560 [Verrucomicrobiota bacterium]|jgi:thiol-disulfide isomerase/thioredoxin